MSTKPLKEEAWELKQAFSVFVVVKLYGFCLKYCIYCASAPSLHRESTDPLIAVNKTGRPTIV